jgi:hypothetical protein
MANLIQLQQDARNHFIGRYGVIGVGETAGERTLLFLLDEWSPVSWKPILKWARQVGVEVGYRVVGTIHAGD